MGPLTVSHSCERLRLVQPGTNHMDGMRSLGPR